MAEKIMLIDGNSIVNRAFYGVPLLTNKEGKYTNGVYGFLNILFKLLDEEKPDHLAVAFDLKAPTFRHKTFDGYKGNRKGCGFSVYRYSYTRSLFRFPESYPVSDLNLWSPGRLRYMCSFLLLRYAKTTITSMS